MSHATQTLNDPKNFEEDDEFEPNVIVDCDILEAAKENIQPLAGGRRATTLAAVLKTPHGQRDARLAATKLRMRERVEEARAQVEGLALKAGSGEGEEIDEETHREETEMAEEGLLEAYVRLVNWTIEHYPRGHSAESGILELLEEATRVLRQCALAKGDARYLNLWLRYAGYVERPEVIFEYLLTNNIGAEWAKLYEEYALMLERARRRTKADEIYLLGIARKAEPLSHLENRHRDFQKRMMVSAPVPESEHTALAASSSVAAPRRAALGELTSSTSTSSSLTSRASSRRDAVSPVLTQDDVFSASSSSSSSLSRPNGKLPIFVDPTGEEAATASRNAWPELGARKERIKENIRAPEKMQGTVLKQRGASKAATQEAASKAKNGKKIVPFRDPDPLPPKTPAKFMPFVDEVDEPQKKSTIPATPKFVPFQDESATKTPAPPSLLPVPESVMRVKAVGGSTLATATSEAEALRKDPFKNYKDI